LKPSKVLIIGSEPVISGQRNCHSEGVLPGRTTERISGWGRREYHPTPIPFVEFTLNGVNVLRVTEKRTQHSKGKG